MRLDSEGKLWLFYSAALISLGIVRSIYTWVTGYVLPDEVVYYLMAHNYFEGNGLLFAFFTRFGYQIYATVLSIMFNLHIFQSYVAFQAMLSSMMAVVSLYLVKQICALEGYESRYSVAFVFMVPIFIAMVPMALTETMTLLLLLASSYFVLTKRYMWGCACMGFCVFMREVYFLFVVANLLYLFHMKASRRVILSYGGVLAAMLFLLFNRFSFASQVPILGALRLAIEHDTLPYIPSFLGRTYETVSLGGRLVSLVRNSLAGYALGFGLIAVFSLVGFFYAIWKRRFSYSFLIGFTSALTYGGTVWEQSYYAMYLTFDRVSTFIRYAHPLILLIFPLAFLLTEKPKLKKPMLLAIVASLVVSGIYLPSQLQSALSVNKVNRLSFDYRAPYLQVADYVAGSPKTLILAEPSVTLDLYVQNADTKVLTPPVTREEFEAMLPDYERVLLYGELHSTHYTALSDSRPWYYEIVVDKTRYDILLDFPDFYLYQLKTDAFKCQQPQP